MPGSAESRLAELHRFGQSPWFDYISRELVARGGLRRMVDRDGLGGVTSNPSIFEKAIGAGTGYDEQILELAREGLERGGDLRPPGGRRRARRLRRARARVSGQRRRGRLRLHRGLARLRVRHAEDHLRGPAPLRRRRPPQRDDQDPRHARGRPGDPRDAAAGPQHQRHAAVLDDSVRGRRRGLPRGARVPAAARPHDPRHLVGGELLRVARRHAGRQAAGREDRGRRRRGGAAAARSAQGHGRGGQRQGRLRALSQLPQRPRLAAHRRLGRQGAAPSVGEHRHQGPRLLRRAVRGRAHRRAHREHAARGHVEGVQRPRHAGAHRRPSPRRGAPHLARARPARHRHGARGRAAAGRGRRPVREGVRARSWRSSSRSAASCSPAKEADVGGEETRGRRAPSASRRWPRPTSRNVSGRPTPRCGRPTTRPTRRSSPTPSAGSASSRASATRSGARASSWTSCAPRGTAPRSCSAWAAPAWRPRSCTRSSARAPGYLDLHVLDSTDPAAVAAVEAAVDLESTLFVVASKSGGTTETACFHAYFYERLRELDARARRPPLRGHHRRGHVAREAGARAGLPRHLRQPRRHRRPVLGPQLLRHGPGGPHRRRPRAAARRRARHGRGLRPGRARRAEPGPAARRRDGRAGAARPRQAHAGLRAAAGAARRLGRAARRREHRQGGHGHPAGRPRAARTCRRLRRRSRVRGGAARGRRRRRRGRGARGAAATPVTRCWSTSSPTCATSAASSCAGRSPSRPPGTCSASTPSTSPTCRRARTSRRGCSPRTPRPASCRPSRRRTTGAGSCTRWATRACRPRCASSSRRPRPATTSPCRRTSRPGRPSGTSCRPSACSCATACAWPPRWATGRATCTPPASSTRAGPTRVCSCSSWGTTPTMSRSRAGRTASACSSARRRAAT